jgi:predicted hydrolase (HD superfamily)
MEKITAEVLNAIEKQIGKHLTDYQPEINNAFDVMEEVTISLSCKLTPEGDNVQVQTNISFVESKVKDKGLIII